MLQEPTIILSFLAGLASFLSPCILPIIPGFLAYLSGTSLSSNHKKHIRLKTFLNSVFFVLGFSIVFALAGILLQGALLQASQTIMLWLQRIGGIVIVIFGLYLLDILKISWLDKEHKFNVKKQFSITYLTSFIFGAAFAAGWTPCIGVILGSVFALATTQAALAFWMLMAYSLGLGLPFLLVGLFTAEATELIKRSGKFMRFFKIFMGVSLIIIGIFVFTGSLYALANWDKVFFWLR